MPSLLIKDGPLAGQHLPVDSELVVGRLDADLTIEDPLISRRHALLRPSSGALEVEDLESRNGTWLNGERVSAVRRAVPGDVITVGTTSMEVQADPVVGSGTVIAGSPEALRPAAALAGPPAAPVAARPVRAPEAPRRSEDELRPVTALFADIVGSTSLGERLAPDEVKALVGECVTRMTRAVEQFGGTVQAFMGDGIAAFFGVPSAHEDDPERAARAGLRILDLVGHYAREVEEAWGISDFSARVGINTGETAVGLVGAADPQSVSLGDTTNVAARLQAAAEPGTIAVGQETARSLLHGFALEPLGEVSVKGRVKPVEAWRLVCAQSAAQLVETSVLVGRDHEIAQLRGILDELTAGRGQILLLVGEAGIGKTRLLSELRILAADRVTWLEGRCFSYGTELLDGPFIQILRSWVGVEDDEAELAVRTKLRAKLGLLPASQLPDVLPYFSRLLALRLDPEAEETLNRLPPETLAAEIRQAYRGWILSLARQGPVVIAIEDIHWADPSTREFAEELLELADVAPVLIVATVRVETASEGWQLRVRILSEFAHRAAELPLASLDDTAARQLLAGLPSTAGVKDPELDQIVASAEGNPLYLEELLNAFAKGSDLPRGQTWAPTVTGARILTPTLESLLVARVDRLPSGARRLAHIAAVVGRSFRLRVLEHLAEGEDLDRNLTALLRADIIREHRRYPEPEYIFKHGLLREACLSTMPPARRRELYGAVGVAFEALFPTTLDEHLEILAHSFYRSDDLVKALDYLERAGERASALDAVARAGELWSRALKVAGKLGDTAAEQRLTARMDELKARTGGRLLTVDQPPEKPESNLSFEP